MHPIDPEVNPNTDGLQPGILFGDYRLGKLLGEGGMGVVFKASRADGTIVALKIMKRQLSKDRRYQQRFAQEARAARGVSNRHLVPVLDEGEVGGRNYLAMAFVDGRSLAEELAERKTLDLDGLIRVTRALGEGLDGLHDQEIVHRDVKPSNVLMDRTGTVALTDFGLAKGRAWTLLTKAGDVVGSVEYMAPERLQGEPATPASDVYSFACTVFECITGTPPFGGESAMRVAFAHMEEEPADPCALRPDLPKALGIAVLNGLEKEPGRRPSRAGEYAELIIAAAGGNRG
jgi:serine/threonine-protein kinase